MAIDLKLIDKLLANYQKPEDIIGENGLLKQLTKAILERAMQAEITECLGYEKHDSAGYNSGNSRNGVTTKTLKGDFGELKNWQSRTLDSVCQMWRRNWEHLILVVTTLVSIPFQARSTSFSKSESRYSEGTSSIRTCRVWTSATSASGASSTPLIASASNA